jgi:hypothetical protein
MPLPALPAIDFEAALASFAEYGFARLGRLIDDEMLAQLCTRADEVMQGQVEDPGFFYQHDAPSGRYEDLEYGQGWQGPSLAYRKIEKMERDPLFRAWIGNPFFERIAVRTIGEGATIYRAVLWNKAAGGGTNLPWHQDDGVFWGLDRSPCLQIWTALDAAPVEAGCLEILPGSHHDGLATPDGGTVPQDRVAARCSPDATVRLAAQAGESFLLHNHTWHRSGRNETPRARRALSISFLSADTRCTRKRRAPREFVKAF